jgi:hypothetical protein
MFVASRPAAGARSDASAAAVPAVVTNAPWPRPAVPNAIRIRLHVGTDTLHLKIRAATSCGCPGSRRPARCTYGGGNVRLVGGYMSTKVKGPNIVIMDDSGTRNGRIVHIEGLLINGSSRVPSGGIKIKAPHTIVQLEARPHRRPARIAARLPRRRGAARRRREGAPDRRLHRLEPLQQLLLPAGDEPAGAGHPGGSSSRTPTCSATRTPGRFPRRTLRGISIGTQPNPPSNDSSALNCRVTNACG